MTTCLSLPMPEREFTKIDSQRHQGARDLVITQKKLAAIFMVPGCFLLLAALKA